jgi:hypothetical protein
VEGTQLSISKMAAALRRLDLEAARMRELEVQAVGLADIVREAVSHPVGSEHSTPWMKTGGLSGSIGVSVGVDEAVVGSVSDVAFYQERGTQFVPPRPFLAPAGMAHGCDIAAAVGVGIASAIGAAIGRR